MAEYGVTPQGFVLKRFDTLLAEVQSDLSDQLGFDISQNQQSMLNSALVYPFVDKIAALWEVAQESYYAKYPSTAEGVNLDNACQYGNIFRKGNMPTEYVIHVTAKDGTVIPKNSLIASNTNPVVQLRCVKDKVVERESCNIIAVKPVTEASGTYTIELNSQMFSYTTGSSDTILTILTGLKNALSVEGYEAEIEDDKQLVIKDSVESRSNEVLLSNNLTTEYVTSCVHYYTVDYGDIQLPNDSIVKIVTNVTGLMSVTNRLAPVPGRLQQSDTSFRQDYIAKSYANSSTQTESIESYLLDEVLNVKSVRCYENVDMQTDSYGRPPKSIEVIVDGGEPEDIAKAILSKKAGGIETYGDVSVDVLGEYGDSITIKFRRPEEVYAWIRVEITPGSRSVDPDYEDIVREIILSDADLTIGDSFMSQKYIEDIYAALPGIQYCKIKVATSADATTEPEEYEEGNITITQRQKVSLVESRIEVALTT